MVVDEPELRACFSLMMPALPALRQMVFAEGHYREMHARSPRLNQALTLPGA